MHSFSNLIVVVRYFSIHNYDKINVVRRKSSRFIHAKNVYVLKVGFGVNQLPFFNILAGHCAGRCISAFGVNRYN